MNNPKEESFKNDIQKTEYDQKLKDEFFDYWSEPDKKGRMKWELEKTWDTNRRLKRWFNNQNKWSNGSSKNEGKAAGAYELLEKIRANSKPK